MYVIARDGEPFEELYRHFKRGMEASGILREYRKKQRFKPAHEERRDKIPGGPAEGQSGAGETIGVRERTMRILFVAEPRQNGLFSERSSPEFLTLVAVVVGLGVGIVVDVLRRRAARR